MPQEVYSKFSPELKLLYRHIAEGQEDVMQAENQHRAFRARFDDQPELRESGRLGDNSHVVAQAMSVEEWEDSRAGRKR